MITERIDHTLLRADATEEDIRGLCEEAVTSAGHINPTRQNYIY